MKKDISFWPHNNKLFSKKTNEAIAIASTAMLDELYTFFSQIHNMCYRGGVTEVDISNPHLTLFCSQKTNERRSEEDPKVIIKDNVEKVIIMISHSAGYIAYVEFGEASNYHKKYCNYKNIMRIYIHKRYAYDDFFGWSEWSNNFPYHIDSHKFEKLLHEVETKNKYSEPHLRYEGERLEKYWFTQTWTNLEFDSGFYANFFYIRKYLMEIVSEDFSHEKNDSVYEGISAPLFDENLSFKEAPELSYDELNKIISDFKKDMDERVSHEEEQ